MKLIRSMREMMGIMLLRFPPLARVWVVVLVLVNLASMLFLDTIYGQAALAAVSAGAVLMTLIHARAGFVRLMGIGHVFWVPMLIWFVLHPPDRAEDPQLYGWFVGLIACNSVSLVIDTRDVIRYLRGERDPYYRFTPTPADEAG